jgi:hypothetical protein
MESRGQVQMQQFLTICISLLLLFSVQYKFVLVLVFVNCINLVQMIELQCYKPEGRGFDSPQGN